MKNKIFNRLNGEPLVWGVPFTWLMILLTSLVSSTTLLINLVSVGEGMAWGFLTNLLVYLVLVRFYRLDRVEFWAGLRRTVNREVDSLSYSTQGLVIR
jgi:hypothetical protein